MVTAASPEPRGAVLHRPQGQTAIASFRLSCGLRSMTCAQSSWSRNWPRKCLRGFREYTHDGLTSVIHKANSQLDDTMCEPCFWSSVPVSPTAPHPKMGVLAVTPVGIPGKKNRPGQPAPLTLRQPGSGAELDAEWWLMAVPEVTTDFLVQDPPLKSRQC